MGRALSPPTRIATATASRRPAAHCAPIEKITGRKPFTSGPSPWIIRAALNKMQAHSEETVIVGDNLRTDILAGFQAGLETVLVLSGVSTLSDIETMPFRPSYVSPFRRRYHYLLMRPWRPPGRHYFLLPPASV